MTGRVPLLWLAFWCLAAVSALAQDQGEERLRIELRITTSGPGAVVVVDRGKSDGLAEGDEVTFRPREGGTYRGVIARLDERTATVQLHDPSFVPSPGTRGEAFVPRSRAAPPPVPAPETTAPAEAPPAGEPAPEAPPQETAGHEAWKNQDEEWTPGMPLLAGVEAVRPEDRATLYSGRFNLYTNGTWSTEDERWDAEVRAGSNLAVENPFGRGGVLEFDVEFDVFSFNVPDDDDDDETILRLDRLSYSEGGTRFEPNRYEIGRFLQYGMPEFGYLDGVEWTHRRGNHRFGASFGYMPELDLDFGTGDDLQAAGFYEYFFDTLADMSFAAGAQKTWHEGKPDRDLLVARFNYIPVDAWDLRSSIWLDLYDSGTDDDKPDMEITEALVSTSRTYADDGLTLTYRRLRFPELLRDDYVQSVFEDLADSRYDRLSLYGYHDTDGGTRFHSAAGVWDDEDDSGGDFELGTDVPDVFFNNTLAGVTLFATRGAFSVDAGVRVNYGYGDESGRWDLYYVWADRHQDDFSHESDDLWEHSLNGIKSFYLSGGWYVALEGDARYFNHDIALSMSVFVQKSF